MMLLVSWKRNFHIIRVILHYICHAVEPYVPFSKNMSRRGATQLTMIISPMAHWFRHIFHRRWWRGVQNVRNDFVPFAVCNLCAHCISHLLFLETRLAFFFYFLLPQTPSVLVTLITEFRLLMYSKRMDVVSPFPADSYEVIFIVQKLFAFLLLPRNAAKDLTLKPSPDKLVPISLH